MRTFQTARRGFTVARGLRRLVRAPVTLADARGTVSREVRARPERFLRSLDTLVWPYPSSPTRRLLETAGLEAGDVRRLVADHGLDGALRRLRDAGVYVSYEELQGRSPARRGSEELHFRPADFFNPVTTADYMATTGGSRSSGTPVEVSFAWQRRQGLQRVIQYDMVGVAGAPTAVWLPVFPSAAGFGAVMKNAAGGNVPERWFSQIPTDLRGIASHKALANRAIPAMHALARAGLPSPDHVASTDPEPVVAWMVDALDRHGRAVITGYASSITAAARWAGDNGVDLTGVVSYPSSEPVTAGKLATMRAAGMRPHPTYAFVPEGTVAIMCPSCDDEEYHVWDHDLAVTSRRRTRSDGVAVDALCWTSLAIEAPRVMVNVENDDYGDLSTDVCDCSLAGLGLRTKVSDVRGISKVVAAGISLDGDTFDTIAETILPERIGGSAGDYQFVERDDAGGTTIELRIHPRVGPVADADAIAVVRAALDREETGVLATSVWGTDGGLRIARSEPVATRAGKTLAYERLGTGVPAAVGGDTSTGART